jgi:hypothetical protein
MKEATKIAKELDLNLTVDARSWHYVGGTLLVMFFKQGYELPYHHKAFPGDLASLGISHEGRNIG